jgi:hypothetical protein
MSWALNDRASPRWERSRSISLNPEPRHHPASARAGQRARGKDLGTGDDRFAIRGVTKRH